jgi:FAD/FMN-containing dehydrogenase
VEGITAIAAGLEGRLAGRIVTSTHAAYNDARAVWNGMIDRHPGIVAYCTSSSDVAECVRFAGRHRLAMSVRSGGHNVAGSSLVDGGLVVDMSEMRDVLVDPVAGIATAQAGARLGDLDAATQQHGLAVPVGVVSQTGLAGLALHGGLGWLVRRHGATVDSIRSVEMVTADGEVRRASPDENPDLYWAVRGGGGNFGIVTSFELQAHPVGPEVWFAAVFYPIESAARILAAHRRHMTDAPEEIGSLAVCWTAPDEEFIPEHARGAQVLVILACHTGPLDEGEEALRWFRELGDPLADLSGPMPFVDVQRFLDADYPDGRRYYWKSTYLRELTDEAISLIVDATAARPSPLSSIDVWALGGALARASLDDTAFAQRSAPILIGIESNWDDAHDDEANVAWARDLFEALQPFAMEGTYLNFPGFHEEGVAQLEEAYGANFERLRAVKLARDPDNVFGGGLAMPTGRP